MKKEKDRTKKGTAILLFLCVHVCWVGGVVANLFLKRFWKKVTGNTVVSAGFRIRGRVLICTCV